MAEYCDIVIAGGGARWSRDGLSLGALVRDTQVSIGGVILVTYAPDGSAGAADVPQPRPRGTGMGGGAGLAAGLFAPPLLAPVAAGAVAGGVIVKFAGHRAGQDIHGHPDR